MADYTTSRKSSSLGWIIGGIVVVLVVLFVLFGRGTTPGGDDTIDPGTVNPDAVEPDGATPPQPTDPVAPAPAD